ncbi:MULTISPECIES: restriction endonuclease subunit S [unclassified Virgibacillus]|uniref:restriction endonuclease subunit S n=1 Tax=unclassified Virgibacillus TaxID=2620237 RepID=UPI00041E6CB8|nr:MULTISPECIES: restriction endonuclease subunit S [Bacillaceae]MDY7046522.1 restriction endonuclease subunit S [Virgibacillus sp. M23]
MKWVKLGDFTNIKTGKLNANAAEANGKYPFFTCSINPSRINSYSYDSECVLVAGNGDLNVKYYNGKFDAYQRTYIVESIDTKLLNVKYLYYFLKMYVEKLREQSIGGVIKYIKLGNLTNAEIPLLDIKEQIKIAYILSKSEDIIKKREHQISKLNSLKQSIFLDMFGNPISNPKGWKKEKLGEYLEHIEGGWSPKCHSYPALNGEWGVLKLGAITKGIFKVKENKSLPKSLTPKEELEITKGDLLFNRKNTPELVGTSAYVFNTQKKLIFPDTIFRLIVKENELNKLFLWQLVNNFSVKEKLKDLSSGSAKSMSNISKQKLKQLEVVVPDIELQNLYAKRVSTIEKQKTQLISTLRNYKLLFNSLNSRAFKGELFNDDTVEQL